jgi:hypothetical protein
VRPTSRTRQHRVDRVVVGGGEALDLGEEVVRQPVVLGGRKGFVEQPVDVLEAGRHAEVDPHRLEPPDAQSVAVRQTHVVVLDEVGDATDPLAVVRIALVETFRLRRGARKGAPVDVLRPRVDAGDPAGDVAGGKALRRATGR